MPLKFGMLGPIPRKDIATASAFFNLTRQLGGSIGVDLLTTLLDRRVAFHTTVVGEKLVATAPTVILRIEQIAQALVLSFNDTFFANSVLIVANLPLILLLGRTKKRYQVVTPNKYSAFVTP